MAYESKKLTNSETRWPTHEKELFVVVYCLKKWQHYLGLHKTKVYTDNISLKYFETMDRVTPKQLRWHDTLALMDVELIHKPGKNNVVPDALSRKEEYMPSSTQVMRSMYRGETDLERRIHEGYMGDPTAQSYLEKLRKAKWRMHDAILVIVDRFSKLARFIPTVGTAMAFSTARIFLEDGQKEKVNLVLNQYLQNFVSADQRDWAEWLSSAEFCYNSTKHLATGESPFLLAYGHEPEEPLDLALTEGASSAHARTRQAAVEEFLAEKANPYEDVYTLDLPQELTIHPTFHVSLLKKFHEDKRSERKQVLRPLPDFTHGQPEYEVETILRLRRKRNPMEYLVKWKGYHVSEASWVKEADLEHAPEVLKEFKELQVGSRRIIRSESGN
ncbi:hypothetical protein R1flu_015240 [Riccia fluitans]|uniref:Chromo domain-containing protein n=1 Tax=Riccia fluitans TaxID=41844 RepID=A0ABD1YJH5_9MARC